MSRYEIEVRALKILRPLGIAFFVLITVFPATSPSTPTAECCAPSRTAARGSRASW
jgi:hypothetical protein